MEAEERDRPAQAAPSPGPEAPLRRADRPLDVETHERCAHHPGRAAVARCDACGEAVCIGCAVPVRGRVLGPGCVAEELGDPALVAPADPDRPRSWVAVAGALAAVVGTIGPWTRTGAGDRLLGAWVPTARWSMVAAVAALALLPVAWRWGDLPRGRSAVLILALLGAVASVLAIVFPPTFQAASWGPWVTLAGTVVAAGGIAVSPARAAGPVQGI
jgi:hypothetical protein